IASQLVVEARAEMLHKKFEFMDKLGPIIANREDKYTGKMRRQAAEIFESFMSHPIALDDDDTKDLDADWLDGYQRMYEASHSFSPMEPPPPSNEPFNT